MSLLIGTDDRWRCLPDRRKGDAWVSLARPLGRQIGEGASAYDAVGLISHGRRVFAVDLRTYSVIESLQHGQSSKWLAQFLGQSIAEVDPCLRFASSLGLTAHYEAKDGTLDGQRSLARFVLRRRGVVDTNTKGSKKAVLIPEGRVELPPTLFGYWLNWRDQQLSGFGAAMYLHRPVAEDVVAWSFWIAIGALSAGICWLDVQTPKDELNQEVRDGDFFVRPASLWRVDPTWRHHIGNARFLTQGPLDTSVLAQNMALPVGDTGGQNKWHLINSLGTEVQVSPDAYALFAQADVVRASDMAKQLAETVHISEQVAAARVLAAAHELEEKACMRFEATSWQDG